MLPAPHPFRVEGLVEQFFVYDGKVSVTVPAVFTKNAGDQTLHARGPVPSVQFGPVPATERSQVGPHGSRPRSMWSGTRSSFCSKR